MQANLVTAGEVVYIASMVVKKFFLLYSDADTRAFDNSGMNPFMLAIQKGHGCDEGHGEGGP